MSSSFLPAWLAGDARAFLPRRFDDRVARAVAVEAAAARGISRDVLAALLAQNSRLPASPAREQHLAALGCSGTVVVATSQPVGLFLGPLATLYGAATAIVNARALERETGHRCVPLVWLQSEDDDLTKVDHTSLARSSGEQLTVQLAPAMRAAKPSALAHVPLGPGIADAHALVCAELMAYPHAGDHLGLLARAYFAEATFSEAFAIALAEVFAEEGLVLLDPCDPSMASAVAPVHTRALAESVAIAAALQEHTRSLQAAGFAAPAAPSDQHGAARLRPLVRDTLLPTAVCVLEPDELLRLAQLVPLYQRLGVSMPMLAPRALMRVLDASARATLDKLGLTADDIEGTSPHALLNKVAAAPRAAPLDTAALESELLAAIIPRLQEVGASMAARDASLKKAAARASDDVKEAITRLIGKYTRALAHGDEVSGDRIDRLRSSLSPAGVPQERAHGFAAYACRYGTRAFTRLVLDTVQPFSPAILDLRP